MKQFYKLSLLFLLLGFGFISCENNDDTPTPFVPGSNGFYVSNSGNFSEGNGSITGVTESENIFTSSPRVFQSANGFELGGITEGFFGNDGVGVVTCSNADKIQIVDLSTMNRRFTLEDNPAIVNPRYIATSNGKAYVTIWGPYEEDFSLQNSSVGVINLSTGELEETFAVGAGPEGIAIQNDKIYVAISNTTNVEVYNLNDHSLVTTIDIEAAPQHFVIDGNNNLWVSASKGYLWPAPETSDLGVVKLVNDAVESRVTYSGIANEGDIQLSEDGSEIYILGSDDAWEGPSTTEVVKFDVASSTVSSPVVSGQYFKGIGVNPANGNIHVAIAQSFSESGSVKIFSKDGTEIVHITEGMGVGPFHFVFY